MASGHQDRVKEPLRNRVTTRPIVPTATAAQGAEGRSGDSANRGPGGWFTRRVMGQPGK